MEKTLNYQLNQWEPHDPIRRTDFNQDNGKLDAALAAKAEKSSVTALETALSSYKTANDAAVAKKAEQTALDSTNTALTNTNTALAALAGAVGSGGQTCRITYGSYVGNRQYGPSNPNTLTFDFYPVFIVIGSDLGASSTDSPSVLFRGQNKANAEGGYTMTVTWSDNGVSWYGTDTANNQNNSNTTYYYMAIGYDLAAQEE